MKYLLFLIFIAIQVIAFSTPKKPELIILTDIGGDPDDQQSLVRLLLYSDMLDIKAICVSSRMNHGQDIKPELVYEELDAYGKVYPNLKLHSDGFPDPGYLVSIVKKGQGNQYDFGEGFDTEASEMIIKTVDEAEGVIFISIWGGQRELAQALWKVQSTRSKEELMKFCEKMQVHAIADQDKHRDWIMSKFGKIRYIADGFVSPGPFGVREISVFRGMYMTGDNSMQNAEWIEKFIHDHGPLSDCYPLNAHQSDGMKEGDTPSFLGLISNGLNVPDKPEWGGWGGRFRLLNRNTFIDAQEFLDGTLNERHTVSRWRPAFQRDFAARVNWCVEPYNKANHNPSVVVNNSADHLPLFVEANGGEKLVFNASQSSDPDGNTLSFNWYFYKEINMPEGYKFKFSSKKERCSVEIPKQMKGRIFHLILETTDNGTPSLTTYKRIIINVL